jgi:predicted metal-dependent phosphoesterase TrpH
VIVDLHTHTTASDGRCTPLELVTRASQAGLGVLSVTDHDTLAGCDAARQACASGGIEFVVGIEITAVRDGLDVHTLGYLFDPAAPELAAFLAEQRQHRLSRMREIVKRLEGLGISLDIDDILQPAVADSSKAVGRPWVARAMVAAGHVSTTAEAFDRWLAPGRPAFIPRTAAPPDAVIAQIHKAGGLASIAHPGLLARDEWLPELADAGLDALEAYHPDHDAEATARYLQFADRLHLAVSGGSDYHADASHGSATLGGVSLPREAYQGLLARHASTGRRATSRATASGRTASS